MKIKITTDSTVDLPKEMLESHGISVIYIPVILGDKEYTDDITPEEMYAYVKKTGNLPKTAAPNAQNYIDFFSKYAKEYDEVIHFSVSSGISLSCQSALDGVKEGGFKNVRVVDGQSLSTGTALLCLKACDMIKEGKSAAEIVAAAEGMKSKLQVSFIIDTMEFLYKNGRCSALSAFVASKLSIKPTIIMNANGDGKMRPGRKYLAKITRAASKYADNIMEANPDPDLTRCFVTYTAGTTDKIVETVRAKVAAKYPFKEIIPTTAGPTITAHCGKGTIGILYLKN